MVREYRPVRRIVAGTDDQGRSCVIHDSDAPNVHPRPNSPGTYFYELWTFDNCPMTLAGKKDGSPADQPLNHSPPVEGAHWRIVRSSGDQKKLDPARARQSHSIMNRSGASELKDGGRHWNMHRTPTLDYGFCLKGERHLVLEETDVLVKQGDIVVQLGNWHAWDNRSGVDVDMAYVMIGGEFSS